MTSIIKVDNLQNQCGANIINENAGTITIGASGDTITLAAGASQSGFGRSGSVNWDTTPKTANFTAVSGEGYFVDTALGAITATLPATPSAGDIVAIADYANTAATNNITVDRNSSPIDGETEDAKIKINGQVYTLVYVDATEGWKTVGQTFNQISTAAFIVATGGTITCDGDFKVHTFTGPGTFTVTSVGNSLGSDSVEYLVVAGGGGGGTRSGGGGGAGGFRQNFPSPAIAGLPVTATSFPIVVGAGGAGAAPSPNSANGVAGNNSVFSTITSNGGGRGGGAVVKGGNGGSGAGNGNSFNGTGGTGNTPPVSPPQGNPGGSTTPSSAGSGGGGATAAGGNSISPPTGGPGGNGTASSITGSSITRAGGGGGGAPSAAGTGGTGGGGNGGAGSGAAGSAGGVNTGGGAGGGGSGPGGNGAGGAGGSGIVLIRYKFQ